MKGIKQVHRRWPKCPLVRPLQVYWLFKKKNKFICNKHTPGNILHTSGMPEFWYCLLKVTYNEMAPYTKHVHPLFCDVAICHWVIGVWWLQTCCGLIIMCWNVREDNGHLDPWRWNHYVILKHQAPITQGSGATSQNKRDLSYTAALSKNLQVRSLLNYKAPVSCNKKLILSFVVTT